MHLPVWGGFHALANLHEPPWSNILMQLGVIRMMVSWEVLISRRSELQGSYVLLTDVNDVTFGKDPFEFMRAMRDQYDLYIGDEYDCSPGYITGSGVGGGSGAPRV